MTLQNFKSILYYEFKDKKAYRVDPPKATLYEIAESANSADPDETAYYEPPYPEILFALAAYLKSQDATACMKHL